MRFMVRANRVLNIMFKCNCSMIALIDFIVSHLFELIDLVELIDSIRLMRLASLISLIRNSSQLWFLFAGLVSLAW